MALVDDLVITPPLPLDPKLSQAAGDGDKPDGMLSRIISIIKSMRIGSDLTRFELPPQLNVAKSQLQSYGEMIYCCGQDLLGACSDESTSLQRFLKVLTWYLSTFRMVQFGQVPFNPTLGETHHVSVRNLNVLLEQVSHHPPVTALYATDNVHSLRTLWWHNACPRFYGNKVEATISGKRTLWLDSHNEVYEMTSPKLCFRLFPVMECVWTGNATVKCPSSGLHANLTFKNKQFFGLKGTVGQVLGKIEDSNNGTTLYELSGAWNKVVTIKDMKTKESYILYDAHTVLGNIKPPVLKSRKETIESTETLLVWRSVMEGIVKRDWDGAKKSKHELEQSQRNLEKQRKQSGKAWKPRFFVEVDGDDRWQWKSEGEPVPDAPLVVPS